MNEPNPPAEKRRQHEHAYWEALRARAYALRAEGKTHEQIAAELGTALSTVSRWLRQPVVRAHVARHRRIGELARGGWSNAAIAAEVGMRADSVCKIRARCAEAEVLAHGHKGEAPAAAPLDVLDRAVRRARIVALSEAGLNNSQIARQIGVTPSSVCQMLARARRQSKAASVKGGETGNGAQLRSSNTMSDTKECPFCLETIKAGALKCKHCGEFLNAASVAVTVALAAAPSPTPLPQAAAPQPVMPIVLEAGQVPDLLIHLVDKNLIVYEEDEHGQGCYRLLETVRQYARDRLLESGTGEAGRTRHRDYFLALAEEAKPNLQGPEQARWLDTLESEHDNLRAALEWCLGDQREGDQRNAVSSAEAGLRLAAAVRSFWWTRGHLSEGRRRFAAALSHPGAQARTKTRADALNGAGVLARTQGDYALARTLLEEGLAIGREIGDKQGMAIALGSLGIVALEQGDYASARSLLEESLALRRTIGDKQGTAVALGSLGNATLEQGDAASARPLYEQSLALYRQMGDKQGIAIALVSLGLVAHEQGDTAWARALYEESLAIRREIGDKQGIVGSLGNLGALACQEGNLAASRDCFAECLTLCRALGEKRVSAYALEGCAALAQSLEQPDRATRLYGAADGLRAAIGVPLTPNEREKGEGSLAALRATLGAEAFDSAWAAGRALTWEQAIACALEENAP